MEKFGEQALKSLRSFQKEAKMKGNEVNTKYEKRSQFQTEDLSAI